MAEADSATCKATVMRATLIGTIAIALWATLALFTAATGQMPPFQLMAMTLAVAFILALMRWTVLAHRQGRAAFAFLRQGWPVWAVGIGGLFGYHFFYFVALRHAPPVDASLIAYLWPLLIVLFSALLPGERLHWQHVAGGIMGLAGAATLIVARHRGEAGGIPGDAIGYGAALACAFTWSIYSVLSRKFGGKFDRESDRKSGGASSDVVGAFCGATAVLGFVAHGIFETTVWPADAGQWGAVLALGLGPVGLAFFVWDYGVKRGDIKALGALSYAAPLLSTLLLILFGKAQATPSIGIACALIVGGAVLAARDLYVKRR